MIAQTCHEVYSGKTEFTLNMLSRYGDLVYIVVFTCFGINDGGIGARRRFGCGG